MRQVTAPLVTIESLSKGFGSRALFEDISLILTKGERAALIGANGSGKSTLFKILVGLEEADAGAVSVHRGARLAYVPQEESFPDNLTIEDCLRLSLETHQHDSQALISIYSGKAGFSDTTELVSSLSGGWKKRLAIICGLIREPDLLLLDEPTNHLDIESIIWLEEQLVESSFAVLFISHDRYFLENVAERVIELDPRYEKGYLSCNGTYSTFLETRETFFSQLASYRDSLKNKVRREVEWLRRGAKARTTKARGRIKQAKELIDELQLLRVESSQANLSFADSERRSRELIKVTKIEKKLAGKTLFRDFTVTLSPGSRLGISGANGAGKTTLVKTLVGIEQPDKGTVKIALRLRLAYFDQRREALDPNLTLKKALSQDGDTVVFNGREFHVTAWAKRFLFREDQFLMPLRALSGGERARVLLAQLMLQPADVLVLDEPTNDLDISTLEVLEDSLCEFAGAVILVTHDRHFLDRVCTAVVGLDGSGECSLYASYLQWELAREERQGALQRAKEPKPKKAEAMLSVPTQPKPQKLSQAERRELDAIGKKIEDLEEKVSVIQGELASLDGAKNPEKLRLSCEELADLQQQIEILYIRWADLEKKA